MNPLLILAASLTLSSSQHLPDRLVVPNSLGVNIHEQEPFFNFAPGLPEKMHEMGFRATRIEIAWPDCQLRPDGPFHMEASDKVVQQAVDAGLRPLLLLTYNNLKITGGVSPDTPEKVEAFDKFVAVCAERYRQFHPMYEIGNEPTHKSSWIPFPNAENYTRVVVSASKTIKDIDPDAYICAASLNPADEEFLQTFIREGGLAYLNAISLHPYNHRGPETTMPFLRHVQNLIKAKNPSHRVGVVVSEWGYADYWKSVSDQRSAEYYPRIYLCGLMVGLDLTVIYEWSDRGQDTVRFGVLDRNDKPKPSYYALKSLLDNLHGYRLSRFRADGQFHEYVMVFTKGSSTKTVAWTTGSTDADDLDPAIADPKTYEPKPVQVEFEGHRMTLTTSPKVFGF